MHELSFALLRSTNVTRCERWHPGFPDAEAWTIADWSNAMAGEAGEAANVVKKMRRIETGNPGRRDGTVDALRDELADELADVVCYADLLAAKVGIDLGSAVARKFNAVSAREGFPDVLLQSYTADGVALVAPGHLSFIECLASAGAWLSANSDGTYRRVGIRNVSCIPRSSLPEDLVDPPVDGNEALEPWTQFVVTFEAVTADV